MENKNFKFKKKIGQKILQDNNILNNIANSVDVTNEDMVIEIGPGGGALTSKLIEKTKNLLCFEIDTSLVDELKKFENLGAKIVYKDFLTQDVNSIIKDYSYKSLYMIANLPYYITTPIISKIIDENIPVASCVFMVQKEVADRLKAQPNSKQYNSLTIFIDYYFEVKKLFDVSRNAFYPKPNVDSSVVLLRKRTNKKVNVKDEKVFFKLIRDSFKFKRKTLKNNLVNYNFHVIENVLKKYNLDLTVRAEALSIEIFSEIANALS